MGIAQADDDAYGPSMASRSIELLFGLGWLDRSDGDDVNILRNFSGPISPSSDDLDDLDGVSYHLEAKISHDPFRHVPFWVRAMYSQADPSEDISDAGGIGFNTLSSAVGLFGGGTVGGTIERATSVASFDFLLPVYSHGAISLYLGGKLLHLTDDLDLFVENTFNNTSHVDFDATSVLGGAVVAATFDIVPSNGAGFGLKGFGSVALLRGHHEVEYRADFPFASFFESASDDEYKWNGAFEAGMTASYHFTPNFSVEGSAMLYYFTNVASAPKSIPVSQAVSAGPSTDVQYDDVLYTGFKVVGVLRF